jgi:3-phosphoshikimate 1-carboxyvinyltransferase
MRLLSGVLAAQDFSSLLKGDASLSKRPMNRVAEPLSKMGARFELKKGRFAPFKLQGDKNIKAIYWKNPVASAQVKSAVLLAALHATGSTVYEEPAVSRDHTERMLEACGVRIKREGTKTTVFGPSPLKPQAWIIPGDISSAAFFIAGGILIPRAKMTLEAVNVNPTRTGILDVLKAAGVAIELKKARTVGGEPVADIAIKKQTPLQAFSVDKTISPRLIDEIPILAVIATQCRGRSVFSGLEELRFKETDRLKAIAENLKKMGARVREHVDGLTIDGPVPLKGATLNSFHDHRIAMAFAIAGLIAKGTTTIRASECVAISFPDFWALLARLCKR